ncbi:hypothetical protein ABPG72_013726 [Tetrahymena utriculariae]
MKPFFKAVLIINHTQNKDNIDFESLKQLAEEKNLIRDQNEFEEIVARFEDLCQVLIKKNPLTADDFNDLLAKYEFDDDKNQKELYQVWEHEKENAYSYLIKKSGNFRKLDKIEWSLNNKFYTKKAKNLNEMTVVVSLKTSKYNNQNERHITFEMNNKELLQLRDDLFRIEEEIIALNSQHE